MALSGRHLPSRVKGNENYFIRWVSKEIKGRQDNLPEDKKVPAALIPELSGLTSESVTLHSYCFVGHGNFTVTKRLNP